MEQEIRFTTDRDSHQPMRIWRLSYPVLPFEVRRKCEAEVRRLFPKRVIKFDDPILERHKKPIISWLFEFVSHVQKLVPEEGERCSFEFSSYVYIARADLDDDSEYTTRMGVPVWFITIRDHDGDIVHKNWTIAIDEHWGDLMIKRGPVSDGDGLMHGEYYNCEEARKRITDAIVTHLRLKGLARKRTT